MDLFISDEADEDLLKISVYLAERNPAAAVTFAHEVDKKFENISHFPFTGRDRASLVQDTRSIVAGLYVIFYPVERDRITIVRVLDGRRDIDAEFKR